MKPKQFNFFKEWSKIKSLGNEPGIKFGIERIGDHWMYLADRRKDDLKDNDPNQAEAEYHLDLITLVVKKWDLFWLSDWMRECYDIPIHFSLGVAETYFPDKEWEIIEQDDYMVVTDTMRTIVFDFLNFRDLPAGASLKLAGDKKYAADDLEMMAAINFKKQNIKRMDEIVSKMRFDIDYFDSKNKENILNVTPPKIH